MPIGWEEGVIDLSQVYNRLSVSDRLTTDDEIDLRRVQRDG